MSVQNAGTNLTPVERVSAQVDEVTTSSDGFAQLSYLRLSAVCYSVTSEVARRRSSELPGIDALFGDRLVVMIDGQATGPLGFYAPEKWEFQDQPIDEIHLNIGHRFYTGASSESIAEDVVTTICHELVHLFARANGIQDTSGRDDRYHNKRFADLAGRMELHIARSDHSYVGYTTPGLTAAGVQLYGDLISLVAQELRLLPRGRAFSAAMAATDVAAGTALATRKYVFANCGCVREKGRRRTLRMARGSWILGPIGCGTCKQFFTESPPAGTTSQ